MKVNYYEGNIREFDLSTANVSVLAEDGYISEDLYLDMKEGDKDTRNRVVGLLIRDNSEVYNIIHELIDKWVKKFISTNRISENNVLEVSHDAVFTINIKGTVERNLVLSFGNYINFVPKHDYISLLEFSPKEESNQLLKFYLNQKDGDITTRFCSLDRESELYDILKDLMRFIYDGNNGFYNIALRNLILASKSIEKNVCSACTNERIVEAFRELALL